jgi:hypothetical protein
MMPTLEAALGDAELLLTHAVRDGMNVPPAIINHLVLTRSLFSATAMTDAQESQFWMAFGALSKLVCPVSVSSLRATMDSHAPATRPAHALWRWFGIGDEGRSLARRAVMAYTIMTMATLLVLLAVQIYWLFGVTVTNDLNELKESSAANKTKVAAIALQREQLRDPAWKAGRGIADLDNESKQLAEDRSNMELRKESSYDMLETWSTPWEFIWAVKPSCQRSGNGDPGKAPLCEKAARLQAAKVVLDNLQRYALPLLYGFLGACVFTLRTLASQIRARAYSESSNIDFRIRLCLGTLGGLVSAWFLIPGSHEFIPSNVSPFALAFLAGYSIELVFTAMDRLIAAFTKSG